ncbi:Protein of unknown function [Pseudobutyrivibrio sp. 49]|uniref:Mbeg1-like protein n=1 Tax=Pseudobutyrivibrio sp. 49 TaxID=1855344 RepID=UPI000887C626|nr:Mbeg1-like protein [Pseudobutyrivibrio sp. 49]SDH30249.1 Protein of unknown function [Pseudobutyrivibrio sp. 49]
MNSCLSIEEIVLINCLLYCENLGGPRGTFLSISQESRTIGNFVDGVLHYATKIENDKEYSTGVTGAEYKQLMWAIRPMEHLKNIIIMQVHYESEGAGGGRSALLFDPSANEAIVAFKGTQSDAEWIDNVSGLYRVPTEFQDNALNWFKSLDLESYDTITVTGHSKGGNKAKFITIMDDRVDNCFSFDGQGFSDEFIRKYSPLILKNQDKILNISAESDFVNILLNDVGKKQFYLGTNYGRLGFAENHCPNAIAFYDDIGEMTIHEAPGQDKKMSALDKMLNSFIRSIRMSTKEKVANMLGSVIVNASSGDTDKLVYSFSDSTNSDSAAKLIAYTLRYKVEKPKMIDSVREILQQNGFSTNMLGAINFVTNYDLLMELIGKKPEAVISILKMRHASDNLIQFLRKHMELFDLLVSVSRKMRRINPLKYSGDDLKAEDTTIIINSQFMISRRTLSFLVFGAIVITLTCIFILWLRLWR